ncbi:MAG: UpxY family transcription antiterminator [Candidatus Korobacteraceae bacterium]
MSVTKEHMSGDVSGGMSPAGVLVGSGGESPKWFAVYTTPRHEKAVARHFEFRRIEAFLPLYREMHRWRNGCKVNVEQPLFPGYIFVRIGRGGSTQVLSVPGVLLIVGPGREPTALPDFEIEALRSGLHLRKFEPHPYLVVGEKARIKSGSLAGMVGVLARKKNNLRVVLTLELIMRSVAVEVDADELERVSA